MTITLTREEAQQVLDALYCTIAYDYHGKPLDEKDTACDKAADVIEARLAQPEPEPVAWGIANTRPTEKHPLMMVMTYKPEPSSLVVPLYTAPPQREWQGLTDEEISELIRNTHNTGSFVRAIEAKLREKNA